MTTIILEERETKAISLYSICSQLIYVGINIT
jgi:hypothetical protein